MQAVASAATPRTVDATVPPAALAPRGGAPHAREQAVQRGGGVRIGAALLLRARHEELRVRILSVASLCDGEAVRSSYRTASSGTFALSQCWL